jgi:solute carrier family 32 (vesicular inhibitory amino acid transporter)
MAAGDAEKQEQDELTLEDGGIEENPRGSFEDGDESESEPAASEDDDDDGVGSPRSFQSHQWPQSYRWARSVST